MTHPILKLLMDAEESESRNKADSYFSASNTDLYHLTTGQAMGGKAFAHSNVVLRGSGTQTYTTIFGLRHILEALASFRFDKPFIEWADSLRNPDGTRKYSREYLYSLLGQPFTVNVTMMPDGSNAFPGPIGYIWSETDPLQVKWVDTVIIDFLRRGSSSATKAARLKHQSDLHDLLLAENAFRRSNDTGGILTAEAAKMVGLFGTSHMRAAMLNGFNPVGTMDHWYVMYKMAEFFAKNPHLNPKLFENQRAAQRYAFREFIMKVPNYGMLLTDTLSFEIGLEDAIIVLKEFPNIKGYSVRVDSGDLEKACIWGRKRLNDEGLSHINISPTGGLRAVNIASLASKKVPFNSSGLAEYFQFGGERQRREGDLYEPPVNVEIVAKLGFVRFGNMGFRTVKISETSAKSSRGGTLDRLRLVTNNGQLVADIEVDTLRTPFAPGRLDFDITSLRLDTLKPRVFGKADNLTVQRPIVPLLFGPNFIGHETLSHKASANRFTEQFASLNEGLKRVDGSHNAAPAGVEDVHYRTNLEQAEQGLVVMAA